MSSSGVEQVGLATCIPVFELIPPHKAKVYTTLVACDSAGGEQHTTEVEDVTSEHAGPSLAFSFFSCHFLKLTENWVQWLVTNVPATCETDTR